MQIKRLLARSLVGTMLATMALSAGAVAYGASVNKTVTTSNLSTHNSTLSGDHSKLTGAPGSTTLSTTESAYSSKYKNVGVYYYAEKNSGLQLVSSATNSGTTSNVTASKSRPSECTVKRHVGYMNNSSSSSGSVVDSYDYWVYQVSN